MKKVSGNAKVKMISAVLFCAALTGCSGAGSETQTQSSEAASQAQTQAETQMADRVETEAGALLLSVNPEIQVIYSESGTVLDLKGMNEAGKNVVEGCSDYKGAPCTQVISQLVEKIYRDGYFQTTVGGHAKNIVLKLEEGSRYPDEQFLEEVAQSVRQTVDQCQVESAAMVVDQKDLDQEGRIGLDKAKEIVLSQLGLSEADFSEREYELDDGVYELEFTVNGVEYEYEVNARNGKVMEADYEHNDDWARPAAPENSQGAPRPERQRGDDWDDGEDRFDEGDDEWDDDWDDDRDDDWDDDRDDDWDDGEDHFDEGDDEWDDRDDD